MRIRTGAYLSIAGSVLVVALTLTAHFLYGVRMSQSRQFKSAMLGTQIDVLRLQSLTGQLANQPTAQLREQWVTLIARIENDLTAARTNVQNFSTELADVESALAATTDIYTRIPDDPADALPDQHTMPHSSEVTRRLVGQLSVHRLIDQLLVQVQLLSAETYQLFSEVDQYNADLEHRQGTLALANLLLMALALVMIAVGVLRKVVRPLLDLHADAEFIGQGNFDRRLENPVPNEIGDLSRAIDRTLDNLGRVTASRDQLDLEVRERRRAQAELARSNRDLEEFSYSASHDLQEPLRKIMAFSDMVMRNSGSELDEKNRDYLERVVNAASRMQALINALLTLSRVSTKHEALAEVDLAAVANAVVNDLEIAIERNEATVLVGPLPTLPARAVQMRQLIQNLLSNALKFKRPDVAPRIEISGDCPEPGANEEPVCRIVVQDNGIGIEAKHAERVFRVFSRLHSREEYPGTGIGLAVCRKIVDAHGGTIAAEGEPGVGTRFIITLPRAREILTS